MATTKLNIGKIPISKGEYQEGTAYQRLNQVTMLGSTYQSKIDDNTSAPAQMGADGAVENINTDKWLCVAVGNVSAAKKVVYNNETSGLEAGNVQEAIDEVGSKVSDLNLTSYVFCGGSSTVPFDFDETTGSIKISNDSGVIINNAIYSFTQSEVSYYDVTNKHSLIIIAFDTDNKQIICYNSIDKVENYKKYTIIGLIRTAYDEGNLKKIKNISGGFRYTINGKNPEEITTEKVLDKVFKTPIYHFNAFSLYSSTYNIHGRTGGIQDIDFYKDKLFVGLTEGKIGIYDLNSSSAQTILNVKDLSDSHMGNLSFSNNKPSDADFPYLYVANWTSRQIDIVKISSSEAAKLQSLLFNDDYSKIGHRPIGVYDKTRQKLYSVGFPNSNYEDVSGDIIISKYENYIENISVLNKSIESTSTFKVKYKEILQGICVSGRYMFISCGYHSLNTRAVEAIIQIVDLEEEREIGIININELSNLEPEGLCIVDNDTLALIYIDGSVHLIKNLRL